MHRTVGDFIQDLADNALEAGAGLVSIVVNETDEAVQVEIMDNGCGMNQELLQRIRDPYYTDGKKHPGRKVGLGIPFLIQTVDQCGGKFSIDSEPGAGTKVSFSMPADHIDLPPMGSLAEFFAMMMLKNGDFELMIEHHRSCGGKEREYRIRRTELIDALGEIETVSSQQLVRQFLTSHEEEIQ